MIKNFTIYGERCSGTKFLEDCFKKYTRLNVTWDFGWKHFFGYNDQDILQNGDNTLFLCIVRDPYQWLMSFNRKRHHIIDKKSTNFFADEIHSVKKHIDNFVEIMEDRNVINGQRYKNIFELRKYKCRYLWYELPLYAKNNYFIRYEDLLSNNRMVMNDIVNAFDIKVSARPRLEPARKGRFYVPDETTLDLINNSIDWTTENTIGYYKYDVFQ